MELRMNAQRANEELRMRNPKSCFSVLVFVFVFVFVCLATSCKTVAPTVTTPRNDSIVIRYEYLHDSVYQDRAHYVYLRGDTVYIHDTVTQKYFSIKNNVDTVYLDKEVVIDHPPEKYIPKFYRICTLILALLLLYYVLRLVYRLYFRK